MFPLSVVHRRPLIIKIELSNMIIIMHSQYVLMNHRYLIYVFLLILSLFIDRSCMAYYIESLFVLSSFGFNTRIIFIFVLVLKKIFLHVCKE